MSVLFADIQGSTALIQGLGPEATAAVLDPPLRAMISAVERYDGVVCHLGDGVLAVFGAPSVCEDHAVRACLAALAIRDGLAAKDIAIDVRMGIHTGDVIMRARRIGRAQVWEPIGAALHVAARLEQTAEPGAICISETTGEQARGFIETAPLPPVDAKGLAAPLARHALIGAHRDADRWAVRAATGLVDIVDRIEELASLRQIFGAARYRQPVVAQIFGAPGIGKSRLLHEALHSPEASRCLVVRLAGDPHGQDAAFHAFGVWLRGWLDIRVTDPPALARARLNGSTAVAGLDVGLLQRLLGLRDDAGPAFADLAPVDAGGAVAGLLRALAGPRRIVLACEDVDCFDLASRELLQTLLDAARDLDMAVVTTSRSRVRLDKSTPSRTISLGPLTEDDTATLLHRFDPALASQPAQSAAIRAKTGGNPLFVEEVSALMARIAGREDGAEPPPIPDRVEALIADRLSRLPRAQKRLVQICSVLGGVVPLRLLSRVMRTPEAQLHQQLLRLQSEQVLSEVRRYPDPAFAFKHALTRDAAYQMMLVARRRELHARTVEALETDEAEPIAARLDDLCRHTVGAGQTERAVAYLYQAAALDVGKSAYAVAGVRLAQAIELSRKLPDGWEAVTQRIQLLLALRGILGVQGRYSALAETLNEAEELAEQVGDLASMAHVMVQRVHVLNIMGRLDEAVALGGSACEAALQHADPYLCILAPHNLAQAHFNRGDLWAADAALRRALSFLDTGEIEPRPRAFNTLPVLVHCTHAMTLAMLGDEPGARDAASAAGRLAERSGLPYDRAFALFARGLSWLDAAPATAAEPFSDGIALCAEHQIEQLAPPLLAGLGHALLLLGQPRAAAPRLQAAYDASLEKTRPMMLCWAASGLALAVHAAGQLEQGRALADEAVDVAGRNGFRAYLAIAHRHRASVHEGRQRRESLEQALALATELGLMVEARHCRTALAAG